MITLAVLAPLLAPASAPPLPPQESVHRPRAERWLARNGLDPAAPPKLEALLHDGFAHLSLGAFDVGVLPSTLRDEERLPDVQQALDGLLRVQLEWISWIPDSREIDAPPRSLKSDTKALAKWIEDWKARDFEDVDSLGGKNLFEATDAKDKVREGAERFAAYMLGGGPLVRRKEPMKPAGLFLIAEREDFVEMISTVGLVELRHQPFFWIEGTEVWTQFDFDGNRVVAMEFATPEAESDYTKEIPMDYKNPRTLGEQVTQLGARSLLEAYFGDRMEPLLVGGFANDLVISVYGEVDTRTDGDPSARTTEAVDVFVHGGNPSGGTIANTADSRWREKQGEDRFLGVLTRAQQNAAKDAEERWERAAGFELIDWSGSSTHVAKAPFFGAGGSGWPPEAFQGDYMEFLRAYRVAFLFWLRTEAAGSRKKCAEAFGSFVRALAGGTALKDAVQAAYALPLSADSTEELLDTDDPPLEGCFLEWLADQ